MFTEIDIEGYRLFERLHIAPLKRVNLFVGRNNCGKTSVLEAVEMLAAGPSPGALKAILDRRQEVLADHLLSDIDDYDLRHVFRGHEIMPGSRFRIVGKNRHDSRTVGACIALAAELWKGALEALTPPPPPQAMVLVLGNGEVAEGGAVLPLSSHGGVRRNWLGPVLRNANTIKTVYVPTQSLNMEQLRTMWDEIVLRPEEDVVVAALKLFDDSIERLAFRSSARSGAVAVKLRDHDEPVPLGTLGGGTTHLLAIAASLVRAADGVLLVDEIDTGLHYSTMEQVWRMVAKFAMQHDVQVFAATHSQDCVRSIGWLNTTAPELADEIMVHRIEAGVERTFPYTAETLLIAAEQHIEVR